MSAVYKKEIRSYLTSMVGYLFVAFFILMESIYFVIYNMNAAYPLIGPTLSAVTFVFMIVVPILTMRTIADEKRQKTDQLLLTAPIKVTDIVIGKFFALITLFAIPMLLVCIYPLIMNLYGTVDFLNNYVSVLGFFLLGCAALSIGLFVSSLTENPIIAAGLSFLILFLCFVMSGLTSYLPQQSSSTVLTLAIAIVVFAVLVYYVTRNIWAAGIIGGALEAILLITYVLRPTVFEKLLPAIAKYFELTTFFEDFENGILDIRGIVYYLSVVAVFLFLTVQSIQKRRWR